MKFEIVRGSKIGNAKERYFIKERSFDCKPSVNVDINVALEFRCRFGRYACQMSLGI